jgi:RecA/RadA recombinase
MNDCDVESCVKFLNRNAGESRPSLENINYGKTFVKAGKIVIKINYFLDIFPNGLFPGIVEISGEENSGKSFMCYQVRSYFNHLWKSFLISFFYLKIIANALLPKKFGGCEANVFLIDTEDKFMISFFVDILTGKVNKQDSEDKELIATCLPNFHIVKCFESGQFEMSLLKLPEVLSAHTNVSLIVVDLAITFYWFQESKGPNEQHVGKDEYLVKILKKLQEFSQEFNVTFVFTRPTHFKSKRSHQKMPAFQYQIELSRPSDDFHIMKNIFNKKFCSKVFRINNRGIHFGGDQNQGNRNRDHEDGDTEMIGIPQELFQDLLGTIPTSNAENMVESSPNTEEIFAAEYNLDDL